MLLNKEKLEKINWVKNNPDKFKGRLLHELEMVKDYFPQFVFKQNRRILYVEGYLITRNNNFYSIKIFYPANYPYAPPTSVIIDKDVVESCLKEGKYSYNNWGECKDGIMPDVIKYENTILKTYSNKWNPNYSIVTIIGLVSIWLHSYEYKKEFGGKWLTET